MPVPSILIVDDEKNLRDTLAIILEDEGYHVTSAANAAEALARLQKHTFDMAFLDIRMPGVSGLELLPQIRQLYPRLPVIILTAHASLESAIEAMRKGANDYLFKPVNPAEIITHVQKILAEQSRDTVSIVQEMRNLLQELEGHPEPAAGAATDLANSDEPETERYLSNGPVTVDLLSRQVFRDEKRVDITPTSFDYLVVLIRHSPEVVSYPDLVKFAQNYELSGYEANELARGRIHELRRAIELNPKKPQHIITVRGVGYRFVS